MSNSELLRQLRQQRQNERRQHLRAGIGHILAVEYRRQQRREHRRR